MSRSALTSSASTLLSDSAKLICSVLQGNAAPITVLYASENGIIRTVFVFPKIGMKFIRRGILMVKLRFREKEDVTE